MELVVENAWYRYPGSRDWALRGAHLQAGAGYIVAVVGPNGSGKTTLLKIAGLLYRPTRGRVLVDGRDPWRLGREGLLRERRRIVYVHEKPVMLRGSVVFNTAYGLLLRGLSREKAFEKALKALEVLGIERLAERNAKKLSAGQAQLVAIARALAVEPELLLLDEPTAHLDRAKRETLLEVMAWYAERKRALLLATHNEALIEKLSSKTIVKVVLVEEGVTGKQQQLY